MPNVVNVPDQPTENVPLVVLPKLPLIYITDIVLLLAHQDMSNMKMDLVSHVTMNVVNVTESTLINVPLVVQILILSIIITNVSSHVHMVSTKITKLCLVTLVMIPVLIVKVQVQNNVWIVSSQDGYTSI